MDKYILVEVYFAIFTVIMDYFKLNGLIVVFIIEGNKDYI